MCANDVLKLGRETGYVGKLVTKSDSNNFHLKWRATQDGLETASKQGQVPRRGCRTKG
jgi:hypothetical protein